MKSTRVTFRASCPAICQVCAAGLDGGPIQDWLRGKREKISGNAISLQGREQVFRLSATDPQVESVRAQVHAARPHQIPALADRHALEFPGIQPSGEDTTPGQVREIRNPLETVVEDHLDLVARQRMRRDYSLHEESVDQAASGKARNRLAAHCANRLGGLCGGPEQCHIGYTTRVLLTSCDPGTTIDAARRSEEVSEPHGYRG